MISVKVDQMHGTIILTLLGKLCCEAKLGYFRGWKMEDWMLKLKLTTLQWFTQPMSTEWDHAAVLYTQYVQEDNHCAIHMNIDCCNQISDNCQSWEVYKISSKSGSWTNNPPFICLPYIEHVFRFGLHVNLFLMYRSMKYKYFFLIVYGLLCLVIICKDKYFVLYVYLPVLFFVSFFS